jgi:Fic family protein
MQKTHYIWQSAAWPDFKWDSSRLLVLLGECRKRQGMLLAKISALGFSGEQDTHANMLYEEAMTTSAIEGERLNPSEVRSSIARKLGLPSAGMSADRHTDGLIDILLDASKNHSEPLTRKRLFAWHAALFPAGYSGLRKIRVGHWRGPEPMQVVSGRIGRETIHYEAMPFNRVDSEIKQFIKWWHSIQKMDGIIRAGIAHFWFVTIHPFEDGNGRIARALTDMALARDDGHEQRYYSLSSQINSEKGAYYKALEQSQKGGADITDWLIWFLSCYCRSIESAEKIIGAVLAKADFWRRHADTDISARQRKVINKLLDAGKGDFLGGLTNRKYASITRVSRATATRELQYLLEVGILTRNPGKGRSVSYDLAW